MDFGLGLVLSFTDNASSGIRSAVSSLAQLSETASAASETLTGMAQVGAFSAVADQMGSSLMGAGQGVIGMFSKLLGHVQETGSEFESFMMTLTNVYGSAEEADRQIGKLLDFSTRSPFEVGDVKDMLIVLKSQGIDAFEEMEDSAGEFRQENLAWISDLMAFKPDIPVSRWKLALTNYLGSGMPLVLRNALDMGDIEQVLGHAMGSTAEERMADLREIVEKQNLEGLADSLSTTWTGVASNVEDAFTKVYKSIADNGVFDKLKESFMGLSGVLLSMDNDQLAALGKTVAEGLNVIVTPLTIVAEKANELVTKVVELCQTNPAIVKWGIVIAAAGGAMLLFGGMALKLLSALGMAEIGLSQFGAAFSSIGGLLKTGSLRIIGALAPLTITLGLIFAAWKTDFAGVRTTLERFVSNIRTAFDSARKAAGMGVNGMMRVVTGLQQKGDFWSNITVGILKVKAAWDILRDAWGDYTISDELFQKMNALGLRPLVEAILDFKWRFDHFKEGFIEGWNRIGDAVKSVISGIKVAFKGTFIETMIDGVQRFFQLLTDNDPESWRKVGVVAGELAAVLLPLSRGLRLLGKVTGGRRGGLLPSILGSGASSSASGGAGGGGVLSNPMNALKMMGSVAILLGGFTGLVLAFGALSQISGFGDWLENGASTLARLSESLLPVAGIAGVMTLLAKAMGALGVDPKTAALGLANVAIFLGGMEALVMAMGALDSIPYFDGFLEEGRSVLSRLFETLEGMFSPKAIAVLGLIALLGKLDLKTVATGVGDFAVLIGSLGAIVWAFGALSDIPRFAEFIETGGDTLASLFEQIGKCVGALAGGVLEGASLALPGIGESLAGFAENAKPFFDMVGGTDLSGIGTFASGFGKLIAAMTGEKVLSFLTGGLDFKRLGSQLAEFADSGADKFFKMAQDLDAGSFSKAGQMLKALSDINAYEFKEGGMLQAFTGHLNIAGVGRQLSAFAKSAKPFFNMAGKVTPESLQGAMSIFDALSGLNAYEFKSGGFLQAITGKMDLEGVGAQLSAFATASAGFFSTAASLTEGAAEKAMAMMGVLQTIGDNSAAIDAMAWADLSAMGEDLSGFAEKSAGFFSAAASLGEDVNIRVSRMMSVLRQLTNIPTGTDALKGIGQDLSDFADSSSGFFEMVSGLGEDVVTRATQLAKTVANLSTTFSGMLGVDYDASAVAAQLTGFASALKSFASDLGTLPDVTGLQELTSSLKSFGADASEAAAGVSQSFGRMSRAASSMRNSVSSSMAQMAAKAGASWSAMSDAASTATSSMRAAVSSSFSAMSSSISSMMSSAVASVSSGLAAMQSKFASTRFSIPQTKIALPHFTATGKFGVNPPTAPSFGVSWYKEGGVFDEPSLVGVGEAGREAVVPLENNTGWMSSLASMIAGKVQPAFSPAPAAPQGSYGEAGGGFATGATYNSTTTTGDTDNSVTFAEGAIQITCQNAGEADALKLARQIMQYIERRHEIDRMLSYG